MEQFEFKCPQCGQMVSADETLRGLVLPCPHCEKGIVVPKKKKPILAPLSQRPVARTDEDYNLLAIQRRIGEPISEEQTIKENEEMSNMHKSSILDLLKLVALLIVIVIVAVDIFSVRSRNKALWQTLETQKTEMESKIKSAKEGRDAQVPNFEQTLKEAEQRTADTKTKAKGSEDELERRITAMEDEHRKELDEQRKQIEKQRASFEKKMQDMREDFEKQKERLQEELQMKKEALAQRENAAKNMEEKASDVNELKRKKKLYRCSKRSGKGEIQVKKRCEHCGGSGKMQETRTRWKTDGVWWRDRQKNSTIFYDCPHCLPGSMKGSGSKGYTFEKEVCPKCHGEGKIEL